MTAKDADAAVSNANKYTSYDKGMCLQFVRGPCWGIGSFYGSAIDAWNGAAKKHPGDRNPPKGAPMFYRGGNYGHIVISKGSARMRSTDCTSSTQVNDADLDWPEHAWGDSYLGWTEDLNGVDLPLTDEPEPAPPQEDDVPNYDHGSQKTAVKIKANDWVLLRWDSVTGDGAMSKGSGGVRIGGRPYSACLHATLDAPAGSTIRAQVYEYESGETASSETNPQVESPATSGSTYIEYNHNGACAKGRGLLFRVTCTSDATLTAADVVVLSWK